MWAKWGYGHCSPGLDSSTAGLSQVLWQKEAELITWQSTDVIQAFCRQVDSCNRERTQTGHELLLYLVSPFSTLTGPLGMERSQKHSSNGELSLQGHTILPILSMAIRPSPIWFLPYYTWRTSLPYLSHSNLLSHPQIHQITAFMYLHLFFSACKRPISCLGAFHP